MNRKLQKVTYRKNNKVGSRKISLKQWGVIIAFLTLVCIMILLAVLSVKCVVEWVMIQTHDNKVMGTVTVAEYKGEFMDTDSNGGMSTGHKYVHYVIMLDEPVEGHDRIEYENKNDYSAKVQMGHRYLIVFNQFEDGTHRYDPDDFIPDRIALVLFLGIIVVSILFRKQFAVLLDKIDYLL